MHSSVIIFGACHLTRDAIDIFQKNNITVYGILDDNTKWHHKEIMDIAILGATNHPKFLALLDGDCAFFLAYGERDKRKETAKFLLKNTKIQAISAIHPSTTITHPMQLGQGLYIGAQVCLASAVTIGYYCMVHSGVIIDHQSKIHDWVTIGAGSIIGAEVTIEEGVTIDKGAIISSGVTIQQGAHIATGAVVVKNVKKGDYVAGNPAISLQ